MSQDGENLIKKRQRLKNWELKYIELYPLSFEKNGKDEDPERNKNMNKLKNIFDKKRKSTEFHNLGFEVCECRKSIKRTILAINDEF